MTKLRYLTINLKKNNDLHSLLSFKSCLQQSIYEHLTAIAPIDPLVQEWVSFLTASEIPLTPIVEPCQLSFRSAIAFKLAKYFPLTVTDLSSQLGSRLGNHVQSNNNTEVWIKVQIIEHNWLVFSCDYRYFPVWLAHLAQAFIQNSQPDPTQGITASSPAAYCQYAHARACSVLRLINQQEFGDLSQLPELPINLPTSARSLLEQILRTTDQLTGGKSENWLKVTVHLSEAFLSFDKDFNLVQYQEDRNQGLWAFKRLLLLNTRFILQELLVTQLNLAAPEEL